MYMKIFYSFFISFYNYLITFYDLLKTLLFYNNLYFFKETDQLNN